MKSYVNLLLKYRKKFLLLLIIVNIVAVIGVFRINFDTDFAIFSTKTSVHQELLDKTDETFGGLSQIVILLEDETFTKEDVVFLSEFQTFLGNNSNVLAVQGNSPESIVIENQVIEFIDLSPEVILRFNESLGEFSNIHVKDSIYYQFTVFIEDDFSRSDIKDIEKYLSELDYEFYIAGDFYNQVKIIDYILFILMFLPPLTIILILLVFKMQIGSMKATVLSIVPAGLGALWTMGLIGYIGREVSILSAVVPIFIIVIGSADGLHFMSHIQDAKSEGESEKGAITTTLKMVGIPMIVTTITSMIGFLSLLSMNTSSVVDLAIYAAIGIMFAGIATWFALPLALVGGMKGLDKREITRFDISKYIKRIWGLPSFITVVLIVVLSILFIPKINNEFNMLMIYKGNTEVRENSDKILEVTGGSIPLYFVIESENILTIEAMDNSYKLESSLYSNGAVKIINPYRMLNVIGASMGGEIDSDAKLQQIYSVITTNPATPVNSLMNITENMTRLLVFPNDFENDTLSSMEQLTDSNSYLTGVQYLMKDLNEGIGNMQFKSIVIALGAVFAMLLLTLRSFKIAIASLLPIIITVLTVYGFLGITGISLNITTTIIFSITIGVGIDYAVHFSSIYKEYLKHGNSKFATEKAFKYTSRPVIANALGISVGLSILMASPLQIHFNVSVLMWVSMIMSVFVTLTILPFIFNRSK